MKKLEHGKVKYTKTLKSHDLSTLDNLLAELHILRVKHGDGNIELDTCYDHCYYEGDIPSVVMSIQCERDETVEEFNARCLNLDIEKAKTPELKPREREALRKRLEKALAALGQNQQA